jgi:periplasmic divalent cation tolerance protein
MAKKTTKKIKKVKKIVLLQVSCASEHEAERIGLALVNEKLAACANVVPRVYSVYRWKGVVRQSTEALLVAKTTKRAAAAAAERVKELHSYDLPSIEFVEASVERKVFDWIDKNTSAR